MAVGRRDIASLFWHYSNKSPQGWFGHNLGLRLPQFGGHLDVRSVDAETSEVATTVPRWLCNADGRICLAAALALFDEVSTFAGVVPWDRQWRPGATVQLSAQAYRPLDVGAGQELVFKTRKVKMGKTLAYVDGNIMGAEGHILAFARHIKFQPMGPLFAFATLPGLKILSYHGLNTYLSTLPCHSFDEPSSLGQVFPLQVSRNRDDGKTATVPEVGSPPEHASLDPLTHTSTSRGLDQELSHADLRVNSSHGNPIGAMHGGAQVLMMVHAARQTAPAAASPAIPIKVMTANLLSAIPTGVGQESACKLTSCRLAPGAAADDDDDGDDPRTRKGPVHQRASAADLLQLHLQNKAVLSPQSIVTVTRDGQIAADAAIWWGGPA